MIGVCVCYNALDDSFEALHVFWSRSQDVHLIRIISNYLYSLLMQYVIFFQINKDLGSDCFSS